MKRGERIGAMVKILSDNSYKIYPLDYFCQLFNAAKSSISEDIEQVSKALETVGSGYIETIVGPGGGLRFLPDISIENIEKTQEELASLISDPKRMLGGGFLYTSDIMYNTNLVNKMATIFTKLFMKKGADYVATVETKGIPLAYETAKLLNLPLIIIRREAKVSEGSTVSINYFSGSYDRIQRMSLSKRAVTQGKKALIIDDFMRAGGSVKGIKEILQEFSIETVGVGVAISSLEPEKKQICEYKSIVYLGNVNEERRIVEVLTNKAILKDF